MTMSVVNKYIYMTSIQLHHSRFPEIVYNRNIFFSVFNTHFNPLSQFNPNFGRRSDDIENFTEIVMDLVTREYESSTWTSINKASLYLILRFY